VTAETAGTAARAWARDLAGWALPADILAAAPVSPWVQPVAAFLVAPSIPDSPSHRRARQAVPDGGSVLDVGCGGGVAAFALTPPAARVTGVDSRPSMLEAFAAEADRRGVAHREVPGRWPDLVPDEPELLAPAGHHVVVCHHVAYNVSDLPAFARALGAAASRRVVMQLSMRHPLTDMAPLWRHFWGLDRPVGPTAHDALEVIREAGLPARLEVSRETGSDEGRSGVAPEQRVAFTRVRLCLPPERDVEIAVVLAELGPRPPRDLATIWWDC
jgi:SAM-dependent methyltransferase